MTLGPSKNPVDLKSKYAVMPPGGGSGATTEAELYSAEQLLTRPAPRGSYKKESIEKNNNRQAHKKLVLHNNGPD